MQERNLERNTCFVAHRNVLFTSLKFASFAETRCLCICIAPPTKEFYSNGRSALQIFCIDKEKTNFRSSNDSQIKFFFKVFFETYGFKFVSATCKICSSDVMYPECSCRENSAKMRKGFDNLHADREWPMVINSAFFTRKLNRYQIVLKQISSYLLLPRKLVELGKFRELLGSSHYF